VGDGGRGKVGGVSFVAVEVGGGCNRGCTRTREAAGKILRAEAEDTRHGTARHGTARHVVNFDFNDFMNTGRSASALCCTLVIG
jgi:hypothetical protein